jgi:hypothetical protein
LYHIYWNIKVEVLNAVAEREVISLNSYFFWLLFPINIYFFYLAGREGLPQVYKRIGYPQKDSTLLIVLGFFFQWLQQ